MLLLGVFGVNAQEWRAIIELHAGIQPIKSNNDSSNHIDFPGYTLRNVWNPLSFGLNYSMGLMVLPQLYAGVGIGGYTSMLSYKEYESYGSWTNESFPSLYFPVFANARWILNMEKKVNPYVDLKIGYQMGVDLEGRDLYIYDYQDDNTRYD